VAADQTTRRFVVHDVVLVGQGNGQGDPAPARCNRPPGMALVYPQITVNDSLEVVIVGAGQAGLATSHELGKRGIPHLVLEKGRVGQTWRERWESFCLVTPNWSMQLPEQPYDGQDPDGFDHREEIVGFLERYALRSDVPLREGAAVTAIDQVKGGGFRLETSEGYMDATKVVLSTGAYQRAHRPAAASSLPTNLLQIDIGDYSEPSAIPDGPVLVVGSGQSGCQIAEELHDSGRGVFLACGRAPWAPRRIGGHDLFWWLEESGFLSVPVESLDPPARLFANIVTSGHDGGHDLHLRTLHEKGVNLVGHFAGTDGHRASFQPDLEQSIEWADERFGQLKSLFARFAAEQGLPAPEMDDPSPLTVDMLESIDLTGFGAAIFAGGFRPDYRSWVNIPAAFDDLGFPVQREGASPAAPGLYFVGVHFLRNRKSSLFIGVGDDARIVADSIAAAS
jgi:putative flavoprotein involved in K+ transport